MKSGEFAPAHPLFGRRARDGGFTIVEVAMATFVMIFGISTSLITMQRGFQSIDTARNITLAAQIMQSEMERIRLLNWAALPADDNDVDLSSFFTSNPALADKFTLARAVTDVEDKEGEMKTITLTVTWTGITGSPHSRRFVTRYTKDGLYDYYYTLAR